MFRRSVLRWKAPIMMVGALIAGVASAVGHHFFYNSLANKATPSGCSDVTIPGTSLSTSKQKVNIAIGTGFAFLFRAFITSSIGASYVQIFWKTLREEDATIASVDALYAVLGSVLHFYKVRIWGKYWLLASFALVFWLVPIAAVVTPATLTVHLTTQERTSYQNVSTVDFTSGNFAYFAPTFPYYVDGVVSYPFYTGPQPEVARVVMAALAQGNILPIPAPLSAPNASFSLSFPGPALRCRNMSAEELEAVATQISGSMNVSTSTCISTYAYLSWVPTIGADNMSLSISATDTLGPISHYPDYGHSAAINFAALPNLASLDFHDPSPEVNGGISKECLQVKNILKDSTIFQCQLYNISYTTDFKYENGNQTIRIHRGEIYNTIPAWKDTGNSCSVNWRACDQDATKLRNFSYQALMDAFGTFLVGSVKATAGSGLTRTKEVNNTVVQATILGTTKQLRFLKNLARQENTDTVFASVAGLSAKDPATHSGDLLTTMESVFENVTMSLMSSVLLRSDPQSPYAPQPVNVTFADVTNIYAYSPRVLWLSYGLSIALTMIIVVLGLLEIFTSGASFSNEFSTVMRIIRYSSLSAEVERADGDGRDPLPDYIAEATINLGTNLLHRSNTSYEEAVNGKNNSSAKDEADANAPSPHEPDEPTEHEPLVLDRRQGEAQENDSGGVIPSNNEPQIVPFLANSARSNGSVEDLSPRPC